MKRLFKIYSGYFWLNLKEVEINDRDFWFGVVSMIIEYSVGIFSIVFIFNRIEVLDGWTLSQMILLYSINLTGFSLWSCFFINTITLPYYIQRGEFDRFLLRPIEPIFQVMCDGFDEDSWGELICGIVLFGISFFMLKLPLYTLILMPIIAVSSCIIYASTSILLSTLSFFTITKSEAANFTMQIKELSQYPLSIYPKTIRIIFSIVFPIAFAGYVPAKVLLDQYHLIWVLVGAFISMVYFYVSVCVWNIGLRKYTSTGS